MGLEIWFVEDIRNALLAANEASAATAAVIAGVGIPCGHALPKVAAITCAVCGEKEHYVASSDLLTISLRAYREGYSAALATVALAFGLSPAILGTQLVIPSNEDQGLPEPQPVRALRRLEPPG